MDHSISSLSFRERLRRLVEDSEHPSGRLFDVSIQVLIVISLITFSIETLPDLNPRFRSILGICEIVIVIIFSVEYVLRIAVSKHP